MRSLVITAVLLALLMAAPVVPAAAGEPIAIIVNRDNPVDSLEENEIRKVYTNILLSWPNGVPIILYDLAINDPLRVVFSEKILGKTADKAAEEWAHLKITNQAKNPPHMMKSQALIIRRVSAEKGAIGYVSLSAVKNNESVKVVKTLD